VQSGCIGRAAADSEALPNQREGEKSNEGPNHRRLTGMRSTEKQSRGERKIESSLNRGLSSRARLRAFFKGEASVARDGSRPLPLPREKA
jgi:hypothetical protein